MAKKLERRAQIKVTDKFLLDLLMLPVDMKILYCSIKEDGIIRLVVEHNSLVEIDPARDELPVIAWDAARVYSILGLEFTWDIAESEGG